MVNYYIKNSNSNSNSNSNDTEMDLVTCIIVIILVISLIYYLMNYCGYTTGNSKSSWFLIIALVVSAVYLASCE
jgi:hypothetical protein